MNPLRPMNINQRLIKGEIVSALFDAPSIDSIESHCARSQGDSQFHVSVSPCASRYSGVAGRAALNSHAPSQGRCFYARNKISPYFSDRRGWLSGAPERRGLT